MKDAAREDAALYDTMKAIRDRLEFNLTVQHPVTPNETITKGIDDPKAKFLKAKLSDALTWLEPLFKVDCIRKEALKCWDKVFSTTFFSERGGKMESCVENATATPAVLTSGLLRTAWNEPGTREAMRKDGGGRYA